MSNLVRTVTIADLSAMLQQKGFRAEKVEWPGGRDALRSAAGGVGFNIVAGNGTAGAYHDFTYFASFRLDGLALDEVCSKWNSARRFGRVHGRDGLLNFELDVLLGTGVSDGYLAVTLELWNQLLNELLAALREEATRVAPPSAAAN